MKRLGSVVRTAGGVAVTRLDRDAEPPGIGTEAVDESLSVVGRVVDVFGPTDRPYVAVSPADRTTLARLVGETLYAR